MNSAVVLSSVKQINKPLYFGFLCIIGWSLAYVSSSLLVTEDMLLGFWSDQFSNRRAMEMLDLNRRWAWVPYALLPAYYLLKMFLVSICIYTGTVLASIEVSFKKVFQIALFAEGIFFVPSVLKLIWFLWIQKDYSLLDLHHFHPLSLLNVFDYNVVDSWLIYPLQVINIFEVLYFLLLSYGLYVVTRRDYVRMLRLTLCTYGTGLFVWIVSVMFVVVTFTG